MKKIIITIMLGMILLMTIIPNFASAEIYLWNTVSKNENEQTVSHHLLYSFDDTSQKGIGKQKDIPISLHYQIQALPYSLTYGQVDYCNLTITHYKNKYGIAFEGEHTTEIVNYNQSFGTGGFTFGEYIIEMRDADTLMATIICHYTDVRSLFEGNVIVGSWTTYMPSFECKGCEKYNLEELSNQLEKNEGMLKNEVEIYEKIQTAIGWNFQIWLIISWVLKFMFVIIGVALIFGSIYYYYVFLKQLARDI